MAADVRAQMMERANSPSSPKSPPKHIVHWFRKGLRLHDNPSLRESLAGAATFRCVFIIDPWFASSSNVGINKWRFLLDCLEDLDTSLKKLKSRLFVVRGQPADVLPKLFRQWGTTVLSFEEDPEPYGRIRDYNITAKCREVGINVVTSASHTLYKLDKIIERNGGRAPLTYHQFQALVAAMPPPLPAEEAVTLDTNERLFTPISNDHDDKYGVPTLEELGFETEGLKSTAWIGGETEALGRLERHLERKAWVASFGKPRITAQSLLANPTGLSPYLRFGCLSSRLFYYQLSDLYIRLRGTRPPISLHGQLLWREFFYCAATRNPNFDRMEGNPICVQIPWEKNPTALAKWANGQTGFPWIDAIMHQLREEGWVHHLARHAVACFLTRGDLWISWEEGMKVFDELMLDTDWSMNAGMWMWWSCSSFFQQFFHCYCPVGFGKKADPNGEYIRRYLPCLRGMPSQYIHQPWTAPISVQELAQCTVGKDYPLPMLDHELASKLNLARIHQVYTKLAQYIPLPRTVASLTSQQELKVDKTLDSTSTSQSDNATPSTSYYTRNSQIINTQTQIPTKEIIIIPKTANHIVTNIITHGKNISNDIIMGNNIITSNNENKSINNTKKDNYDFNNLAITSKALDYANKFFNSANSHHQNKEIDNYQKYINHNTPKILDHYLYKTDSHKNNIDDNNCKETIADPVESPLYEDSRSNGADDVTKFENISDSMDQEIKSNHINNNENEEITCVDMLKNEDSQTNDGNT